MCGHILGKKLCKYNQRSNWSQRPLRLAQLHYAALDAAASLICGQKIYANDLPKNIQKLEYMGQEEIEFVQMLNNKVTTKEELSQIKGIAGNESYIQNEEMLELFQNKSDIRFVVDLMLERLVFLLRNLNFDTILWAQKSRKDLIQFCEEENRVLISRDKTLLAANKKFVFVLLKLDKPDDQLKWVVNNLKLKVNKGSLLGRCVKCNHDKFSLISHSEAMPELNWKHLYGSSEENPSIKEFWRCFKCRQIYWEGATFDRAKKRFNDFIDQNLMIDDSVENKNGKKKDFDKE